MHWKLHDTATNSELMWLWNAWYIPFRSAGLSIWLLPLLLPWWLCQFCCLLNFFVIILIFNHLYIFPPVSSLWYKDRCFHPSRLAEPYCQEGLKKVATSTKGNKAGMKTLKPSGLKSDCWNLSGSHRANFLNKIVYAWLEYILFDKMFYQLAY